ncbi:uncharacterized protein LOC112680027 [Sipha flava]|uniref:Uncharacterized protein LOC112680027 n=1 Tax=Sipha flava TaxID=143950 RepID=A0A8B8F571_9HEMI|nr:uncharacterized protein LOC112680027 [Sipha flava]
MKSCLPPDFHKSIPVFDGLNTRCQALDWLKTVNRVADINRWPDNFKLQSVRNNLGGPAGHWFLSRNITSWIDFENQFKRTFVGEVLVGDRWKEMTRRVQRKGENVLEYFHEKVHLCAILDLGLQETKIQILEGLFSKDLSMHLLSRDHVDTDELLNDIVNFERLDTSRTARILSFNVTKEPVKTMSSDRLETRQNTNSSINFVSGPTKRCFNCGAKSHIAPACPKPRIEKGACYQCGSTTHQRSKCPALNRYTTAKTVEVPSSKGVNENESRIMNVTSNRTKASHDHPEPYEVTCSCNVPVDADTQCDITFVAIIDTGSPISLVKHLLGMFKTDIFVNDNTFTMCFYVVPENTMTMNAILGRDFVTKPGVNLSFKNGVVHFDFYEGELNKTNDFSQILCVSYEHEFDSVKEMLNVNPELDVNMKELLFELYQKEYVNKIKEESTLDINPNLEMKIVLKHDQPIAYRARRISYDDKEKLRNILDELLREGTIRESRSPYSSLIVLIKKKNGDTRLCIDYCELNKITVKDNFPAPLIDDQIDSLKNKKYYSLVDLKNGFHHVQMNASSVPYTSFVTPLGQYEYLKMPFGLTNAPKVFARFMLHIFSDLIKAGEITLYLDVGSDSNYF